MSRLLELMLSSTLTKLGQTCLADSLTAPVQAFGVKEALKGVIKALTTPSSSLGSQSADSFSILECIQSCFLE
jgi:hypothetical protein